MRPLAIRLNSCGNGVVQASTPKKVAGGGFGAFATAGLATATARATHAAETSIRGNSRISTPNTQTSPGERCCPSVGAVTAEYRRHGQQQDPQVAPQRQVLDVLVLHGQPL